MGGQDAHASGATGGNGLRYRPFLATEVSGSVGPFTDPEKEKVLRNRTSRAILQRLNSGVVQGAEGYVFELERRAYIKAGPYVPEDVLGYPKPVKADDRHGPALGNVQFGSPDSIAHRQN